MISVEEAIRIIRANLFPFKQTEVSLPNASGRILHEDILADRDFPPFDRVAMDGIAISFSAFETGQRSFRVAKVQHAGDEQEALSDASSCLEVMTGSVVPEGADAVVRYEDIDFTGSGEHRIATIHQGAEVVKLQNVHARGSDKKQGEILIKKGTKITPAEIGMLASVGKVKVKVSYMPQIAVIATGNELVGITDEPADHQIRQSNSYAIQAALKEVWAESDLFHIEDDRNTLFHRLHEILQDYDILIITGGVSKGQADFVPEVLKKLDFDELFHTVAQKPGKPIWFGKSHDLGKTVFALPGNPVSSFLCYFRYVEPWLLSSVGQQETPSFYAVLERDVEFKPALTYFLQVKVYSGKDGRLWAKPIKGNGSGDHTNLGNCDGFLELPPDRTLFKAGEAFPLFLFRR